jgi:hypothetical protein
MMGRRNGWKRDSVVATNTKHYESPGKYVKLQEQLAKDGAGKMFQLLGALQQGAPASATKTQSFTVSEASGQHKNTGPSATSLKLFRVLQCARQYAISTLYNEHYPHTHHAAQIAQIQAKIMTTLSLTRRNLFSSHEPAPECLGLVMCTMRASKSLSRCN